MLRILEYQPYLTAQGLHVIAILVDIFSIIIDCAAAGTQKPVQMLDQRGLSGSGMTDQPDKLSIFDLKADIL